SGNVIVAGVGGTVGYSKTGTALWTNSHSGYAIAVDSDDIVYVAGAGTVAYSKTGAVLWTHSGSGCAVTLDSCRHVVGASPYGSFGYSKAGVPLWTNLYSFNWSFLGYPQAVAIDSSDNVFVTGSAPRTGTNNYDEWVTVGYSAAGVPLWTNRYHGWDDEPDYA